MINKTFNQNIVVRQKGICPENKDTAASHIYSIRTPLQVNITLISLKLNRIILNQISSLQKFRKFLMQSDTKKAWKNIPLKDFNEN